MKKQVLKIVLGASLCFLHGGLSALIFAPYSTLSYVPTNGLVGWWPFNGNANDASGNGNNLLNNGGIFISDRYGSTNSACGLKNVGTNLSESNMNPSFSTSNQSISFWFQLPTQYNYSTLTLLSNGVAYSNGFNLFIDQNDGAYGINNYLIGYMIGNGQSITFSSNQSELTKWNNIISTFDGSVIKVYFNNVLKGALNYTGNINPPNNDILIANWGNPSVPVNTVRNIDDIGIWNRALIQQEITNLYTSQTCVNPLASINPQSNTTYCQGGSVTLQANTGNNYTYEWYRNGTPIPNANQSSYMANTSGNYTVKVSEGACNATSVATAVTVNANPSVSLTSIGAFTNYTAAPVILSGSPSGGTYSGAGVNGNNFNPKQAGLGITTISYSYTTPNNCSGSSSTSTIVYDTLGNVCSTYDTLFINATLAGVNQTNLENTLKVYPNPANTHITIDNGNYIAMAGYNLKITNNVGQQVFQSAINQAQFYIDLSTWKGNGLYFIHLIDPAGSTVTVRKMVLQ